MKTFLGKRAEQLASAMPKYTPNSKATYSLRGVASSGTSYYHKKPQKTEARFDVFSGTHAEYAIPLNIGNYGAKMDACLTTLKSIREWALDEGDEAFIKTRTFNTYNYATNEYVSSFIKTKSFFIQISLGLSEDQPVSKEQFDGVELTSTDTVNRHIVKKLNVKNPTLDSLILAFEKAIEMRAKLKEISYHTTTYKSFGGYGKTEKFVVVRVPLTDKALELIDRFKEEDKQAAALKKAQEKAAATAALAATVKASKGADDVVIEAALKILKQRGNKIEITPKGGK